MSSPQFETFLARLYSDREFLDEFLRAPERVTRDAGLDHREQQAAVAIDRAGLLMAARSYELKRQARRRSGSPWRLTAVLRSILPLMKKLRSRRPPVDPHL
jgi:hypothetical protein